MDPDRSFGAFATDSELLLIGPLSLVTEFDLELAEVVTTVSGAGRATPLLAQLEGSGLLRPLTSASGRQRGSGCLIVKTSSARNSYVACPMRHGRLRYTWRAG